MAKMEGLTPESVRPSYAVNDGDALFPRRCLWPGRNEGGGEHPALSLGIMEVELASDIRLLL